MANVQSQRRCVFLSRSVPYIAVFPSSRDEKATTDKTWK